MFSNPFLGTNFPDDDNNHNLTPKTLTVKRKTICLNQANFQNNFVNPTFTPPPPPPPKLTEVDLPAIEDIKTDAEVEEAFSKEKREIFDGNPRKPSEIIQVTRPKHKDAVVLEFEGNKPSLIKSSFALKNPGRYRKRKKREL